MTDMIRFCSIDGFFVGEVCPTCGRDGVKIINESLRRDVSGFLSGLLRHFGDEYNLHPKSDGWVDYDDVSEIVKDKYDISDIQLISIINSDPKGRYELSQDKIRAVYGHSIEGISIDKKEHTVPDILYHGTAPRFTSSIQQEGIIPQSRNKVHLSSELEDAVLVGKRHSDSDSVVVLHIDSNEMRQDGYEFFSSNGNVYTVSEVPPGYIKQEEYIDLAD